MAYTNAYSMKSSSGIAVIYNDGLGNFYKQTGGSPAWRNNNPGNIIAGIFSKNHGAIGKSNGFAVFPDYETGARALRRLLETNKYQKMNIGDAISAYAPPNENNTSAYQNFIVRETGLSLDTPMRELSCEKLGLVMNTIIKYEGTKSGKKESVKESEKFIWCAKCDKKSRPEHAQKDGKVFYWMGTDELPGHDFNCRCIANFCDD